MRSLFTDNHLHRLRRISLALALLLVMWSSVVVLKRILELDFTLPIANAFTAISLTSAGIFLLLGVALVGQEFGRKSVALLAIVPGFLGAVRIVQIFLPFNLNMSAMIGRTHSSEFSPLSVHVVASLCIVIASASIAWLARTRASPTRAVVLAFAASALGSVGFSSLLGYELQLPAVYRWGTDGDLLPGSAGLLLLLGVELFVLAWREQQRIQPGAPTWLPMPFVIGSATLSCILWLGLREVETVRVAGSTQIVLRDFATAIDHEFQQSQLAVEQLSHLVAQDPDLSIENWRTNARTVKNELIAAQAIYRLTPNLRTELFEPTIGNESFDLFDQGSDPVRRSALENAREKHHATITATVRNAAGVPGVAIYAPILRSNELIGYTGAEFSYQRLCEAINRSLKMPGQYEAEIAVGGERVYQSSSSGEGASPNQIEEVFDIADRRVRIEIAPTLQNLRQSRGFLPELALGAGWGITLLLGLSVHLARAARSSLLSAELSNAKLVEENEERRRIEEQLRLSQASARKLSLVASKTDNLVIIASPDGLIEWVNESFEQAMEYQLNEIVGRNPADFMIGPETDRRTVQRIKSALRHGKSISTDLANYSKSGKKFYLHLEIQPVHNEAGRLENFIGVQVDITARVEMEQNLRLAKTEADAASRAKSEFLASMSHEIRTPMNGVIGMTSLLLDTPLTADQRDCVSTIRNSGDALLTIINEILDFSKIESGKMELEHLPFELAVCVEDCLDLFSVQAAKQHLELVYFIEADVPGWLQGDVTRLRQVLVNLVNNAVKFTPSGSVTVNVRCSGERPTGRPNERVSLEFSVIDTGIGIPADRVDRLFRPFSQVDSSTTRKYGGTGLGLVISQRLCQLMGGTIRVDTGKGNGATFVFNIEVEPVNTPSGWGLPVLPTRLGFGDILCVQGHPVMRKRLNSFLTQWGARPVCIETPSGALEYLKTQNPIAVIFDYSLVEVHRGPELRDLLSRSEIPSLLLLPTGESADDLTIFSGRRGVATVSKPVRTNALIRNLQALFESPPDSLPPFVVPADTRLLGHEIPLDILLVEDNSVNQKVALRFLDRLGYRADAVANGIEALNTLRNRHYHLVFMDLQMPEMDGFAAAREIRRLVGPEKQPKIVALTANALHGDREHCLAAGMDDYITKPVKILDIAQVIRRQYASVSRAPYRLSE